MLCICSFLMRGGRSRRCPGGTLSPLDTPLAPEWQGRLGTQGELPRRGKRRCPGVRVPRQWGKSPAELDFYGEFYAALCGAPVLPVLPKAKYGRRLRPKGAKKARRRRAFFSNRICMQIPENRGRVPRFSDFKREKVSVWELSDVRVLRSQNTACRRNAVSRQLVIAPAT